MIERTLLITRILGEWIFISIKKKKLLKQKPFPLLTKLQFPYGLFFFLFLCLSLVFVVSEAG